MLPPAETEGEHLWLQVRKRGANTGWVAAEMARAAGVREMDVGYAGLKDRHAVTTQWFSIWLAQRETPKWQDWQIEGAEILQAQRAPRKLRRGEHQGNRFKIRLRNLTGELAGLENRLQEISAGIPNYFGEQRFGRGGNNLDLALKLVEGGRIRDRKKRGFALSAARSWLFNQVLAERVRAGNWRDRLEGECEDGPSGPLWGRGRNLATGAQGELEATVIGGWPGWADMLEHAGLQQERRSLVLSPHGFRFELDGNDLVLEFALPVGAFATAVLGEFAQLNNLGAAGA